MQDDTVNAAAIVLAAAARSTTGLLPHHHQQVDDHACATTTRWWSRLKARLLCFRSPHGHPRRIADHASPEPLQSSSTSYHTHHATRPAVAFMAPPSSPASSLLTSGSPSPAQVLRLNLSSYSSPTASIFAVGPYAREPQQLVSPPAFSAGLTEPSTAPLTPPPESASACCLQPGSSPEVPFARFLSPPFQAYGLPPESPIVGGALVSPVSTSSSPPPAWLHRRSEEGSPPSGEFVFGRAAAGEWRMFADGEGGGRRSCGSISIADDAAEDCGNRQWPFRSSFPK